MNTNLLYKETINKVADIANPYLDDKSKLKKGEELKQSIDKDNVLKLPIIGEFNAGKSTLLNSILERPNLLPTAITPETAVAYELHYSTDEHLELIKGNSFERRALSEISNANVDGVDYIRVFINNPFIQDLEKKGLVIVDMPGINSGLERHAKALSRCLSDGSVFTLCSDVTQGTLTLSSINFLSEISGYRLRTILLITKSDLRPKEDGEKVKANASSIAAKVCKKEIPSFLISANDKDSWNDFTNAILELDAEALVKEKYSGKIKTWIAELITVLTMKLAAAQTPSDEFDKRISEIQEQKDETMRALDDVNSNAQSVSGSVDDILNDINEALYRNLESLTSAVINKTPGDQLGKKFESIIRPVIGESVSRELSEYQEVIGQTLADFSKQLSQIIGNGGVLPPELSQLLGSEVLKVGIGKLATRFTTGLLGKILATVSKFAGPIAFVLSMILPGIITKLWNLFTNNSEKQRMEVSAQISGVVFPQIIEKLRPEITSVITENREKMLAESRKNVLEQCKQFDDAIAQQKALKNESDQQRQLRISELSSTINQLTEISKSLD